MVVTMIVIISWTRIIIWILNVIMIIQDAEKHDRTTDEDKDDEDINGDDKNGDGEDGDDDDDDDNNGDGAPGKWQGESKEPRRQGK